MVINHMIILAKSMKQSCLTAKTTSLGRLFQRVVEQIKHWENWYSSYQKKYKTNWKKCL